MGIVDWLRQVLPDDPDSALIGGLLVMAGVFLFVLVVIAVVRLLASVFLKALVIGILAGLLVFGLLRLWEKVDRSGPSAESSPAANEPSKSSTSSRQVGTRRTAFRPGAPSETTIGGIRFVRIPAGESVLGSLPEEPWSEENSPRRTVRIEQAFYLAVTEVTVEQYNRFSPIGSVTSLDAKLPVTNVSWRECEWFCWSLNGSYPEWEFRLPTEDEWEYACRAGFPGPYPPWPGGEKLFQDAFAKFAAGDYGFLERKIAQCAWFDRNGPRPVGTLEPNPWGMHDMAGNVWEWCSIGELEPPEPDMRPIRGGGWPSQMLSCRPATRAWEEMEAAKPSIGFRILATPQSRSSFGGQL